LRLGIDAAKVKTLTREEFFQRRKDYGLQRTALMTCMTCSDTASQRAKQSFATFSAPSSSDFWS
jgi:hypothetical protein